MNSDSCPSDILSLIETLARYPGVSTFVGAVITLSLGLITIYINNRHSFKLLEKRFETEAISKKNEKLLERKTASYIETLKAISKLINILAQLPTAPANELKYNLETIPEFSLVAPEKSLVAATRIVRSLTLEILGLLPKRFEIDILDSEAKSSWEVTQQIFLEKQKLTQEITAFNLRADTDYDYFQRLRRNYEFQDEQHNIYINDHAEKIKKSNSMKMQMTLDCIRSISSTMKDQLNLLKMFRDDLGTTIDLDAYTQEQETAFEELNRQFSQFNEQLNQIQGQS